MKNKKRIIMISGFIIVLCSVEFIIAYFYNNRDSGHVILSTTQAVMTEAETEEVNSSYIGSGYCITCWGDSLTEGTGSWVITMPSTLEDLTKIKTYNMGVFGEDSRSIACRQGGLKMYVNNIIIPASGSIRFSQILCDGNPISLWKNPDDRVDPYGITACFNNCSIGGITGKLTYDYDTDEYIFTRAENQKTTSLYISSPTEIIIPISKERKNDILILEMGNNGGYDGDYSILVEQYQAMINYSGNGYYIIIGDTDYSKADKEDWENALQNAFGDHFFNMRQYLVDLVVNGGLYEYDIAVNEDDIACIDRGEVPYCLKVEDKSHLNSTGYEIEGKAIYEKGLELGYWLEVE